MRTKVVALAALALLAWLLRPRLASAMPKGEASVGPLILGPKLRPGDTVPLDMGTMTPSGPAEAISPYDEVKRCMIDARCELANPTGLTDQQELDLLNRFRNLGAAPQFPYPVLYPAADYEYVKTDAEVLASARPTVLRQFA